MTRIEQEYYETEKFLKHSGIEYIELLPCRPDPPDFILKTRDKVIALEHSLLPTKDGDIIIPIYKMFDRVIEKAQKLYESTTLPAANVKVRFNTSLNTKKGNELVIVNEIFEKVRSNVVLMQYEDDFDIEIPDHELLPYTSSIHIRKTKSQNVWQRPALFWSGPLDLETLTDKISKKNRDLVKAGYKANFQEAWLLLIVAGKEWSEFSTYRPNNFKWNSEWQFDKIFIHSLFGNEIEIFQSDCL